MLLDFAILPGADLSNKNFRGTSLQNANLDNVNFENSDFSDCNFTEVRLERTTPIQAVAVSSCENNIIYALYDDGIIRKWEYQEAYKPPKAISLSCDLKKKEMKLIAQPGKDLTIFHEGYILFFDCDTKAKQLRRKAKLEVNPAVTLIRASRHSLLITEESGNKTHLRLIDIDNSTIIKSMAIFQGSLAEHLGSHAFVIYNEVEGLAIIEINSKVKREIRIPTDKIKRISCLAACICSGYEDRYLLGFGQYDGVVQVWQVNLCVGVVEDLMINQSHKNIVKEISFIDENRIISGSFDKTMKLLTFDGKGKLTCEPKIFELNPNCSGMKVNGVIREQIEQNMLRELIAKVGMQS